MRVNNRWLVTGGAGFIGGAVVRRLLNESTAQVFNLDKLGYASDLSSIEALPQASRRHHRSGGFHGSGCHCFRSGCSLDGVF